MESWNYSLVLCARAACSSASRFTPLWSELRCAAPIPEDLAERVLKLGGEQEIIVNTLHKDQPAIAFCSAGLMEAIWAAFASNRYGDRVSQIAGFETWWHHLFTGPTTSVVASVLKAQEFGRAGRMFDPPYHFSDSELSGNLHNDETRRRLSDVFIPEYIFTPDGLQKRGEGLVYPGYSREKTFRKMLIGFDADFLLREISEDDWQRLSEGCKKWSTAVHGIIQKHFFPNDEADIPKISATVLRGFGPSASRLRDLLPGWARDALNQFETSGRILRRALENAQRLSLDDLPALPVVVLTHKEILQNWKSFLGLAIRGKLIREQTKEKVGVSSTVGMAESKEYASEALAEPEDVSRAGDLLDAVWRNGACGDAAKSFVALALELPWLAWLGAIQDLQDQGGPAKFVRGTLDALKVARISHQDEALATIQIEAILNRARS